MSKGYVYVLTNPCMPHLVKIGRSENDPQLRAAQLYTTGVPSPFEIKFVWLTEDCVELERTIHDQFSARRYSNSREFFVMGPLEVINYVLDIELAGTGLSVVSEEESILGSTARRLSEESEIPLSEIMEAFQYLNMDDLRKAIAVMNEVNGYTQPTTRGELAIVQ